MGSPSVCSRVLSRLLNKGEVGSDTDLKGQGQSSGTLWPSHLLLTPQSEIISFISCKRLQDCGLGMLSSKVVLGAGHVAQMVEHLPRLHKPWVQSPGLHEPGVVEGESCPFRLEEMTQWVQCLLCQHADPSDPPAPI